MFKPKFYQVRNYKYDGLFAQTFDGVTLYNASFECWTEDPGIALFNCSDGRQREIPTCAIIGFDPVEYPPQERLKKRNWGIVHVGHPAHS